MNYTFAIAVRNEIERSSFVSLQKREVKNNVECSQHTKGICSKGIISYFSRVLPYCFSKKKPKLHVLFYSNNTRWFW
jgi:hypothetical protein